MKKILYARNAPYKPNINTYNVQAIGLCKELCKKGIDCDILFYSDEDKDEIIYKTEDARIKILWRKGIKILRTGLYPKLLNKDFTNQYDLIVTTEHNQIMSYFWTKYHSNVVMYSGPYYNMFKLPFMEKIYDRLFTKKINENMKKIFVKSTLAKDYLLNKGYSNIEVIGVGLDEKVFENEVEISQDVKELVEYMKSNKCILYIGQLIKRKNFEFLIKVFEEINKKHPEIKLVIIGKGKEEYVKLVFDTIDSNVKDNIFYRKRVDNKELKYVYSEADVFILPSIYEIFGMVLLEAMYFGIPVVSSNNGGANTLIKNKYNGIIEDNFNINQWARDIEELFENDQYRRNLSIESKKSIIENYTWSKIKDKFLKLTY